MGMLEPVSTVSFAAACLALVGLSTIPSIQTLKRRLSRRLAQKRSVHLFYEDEDGIATDESQAAFSDSIPRYVLLLASVVGFLLSLTSAVFATIYHEFHVPVGPWLLFTTWFLETLQTFTIFSEKYSPRKATLGIYAFLAALLTVVELVLVNPSPDVFTPQRRICGIFHWVQVAAGLLQGVSSVCLPRRPDVYWAGQVVDGENTNSTIGRYSFAWAGRILDLVKTKRNVTVKDLPVLCASMRAEILFQSLLGCKKSERLWRTLLAAHYKKYLAQWFLVGIVCFTQFLPQFFLLQILSGLESSHDTLSGQAPLWTWVIGLGSSIAINSWIENNLNWLSLASIGLATYEQLSAMIVWKGMRRKDIKGDQQSVSTSQNQTGAKGGKQGSGDAQKPELKQSSINLLAVDAQRVADFASTNYQVASCILKLGISFTFLAKLVGLPSLAVGLGAFLLSMPVNTFWTKKYSQSQSQLMKIRDQKLDIVTEALLGIRQVKFSALEEQWHNKIKEKREEELAAQWRNFGFNIGLVFVWIFGPVMLSALTLGAFVLLNQHLTASVAFTTISIFNNVEATLGLLPELTTKWVNAKISTKRIEDYLNSEELDNNLKQGDTISFKDVTLRWPSSTSADMGFALRNINLQFPRNELSIISGRVGTGKSLLLASILGEADIVSGDVTAPSPPSQEERFNERANPDSWIIETAFAYVPQVPWIQNATIQENVLFGLPYLSERYARVMRVCALEKDMELLEFGDQTDIGSNGVNLSGGQKWRLAFARALYSRAGVLILDDIFSALDANVGKFIYDNALTGELGRGRTRVLVTHHLSLCLSQAEYCVFLANGTVEQAGLKESLLQEGHLPDHIEEEATGIDVVTETPHSGDKAKKTEQQAMKSLQPPPDTNTRTPNASTPTPSTPTRFMTEEKRETGVTKLLVYKYYISSTGILSFALVLFCFIAFVGLSFGRTWWISVWTRSNEAHLRLFHSLSASEAMHQTVLSSPLTAVADDLWYYLGIYIGLSGLACLLGTMRYYAVFHGSMKASRVMFERLIYIILRMPLRWLDTVPTGTILNRLTADFNVVDSRLAQSYAYVIYNGLLMIGTLIAGVSVSYYVAFFVVILLATSLHFGQRYLIGAREVKRLESVTKSPIYEQFGSVLTGISTVRAYRMSNSYVKKIHAQINDWARTYWYLWLFSRWLNLRLNMLGTAFTTLTAILVITIHGIDASLAGFCLSFVLQFSQTIIWAVRDFASLEIAMNSVERISEYCKLDPEDQSGLSPPAAWPTAGRLELSNLVVSYAPDLDPVLKGLSFRVESNERIGIVGRTGAGKSSLTLALFRFLEAQQGSIHIDGIDISKIRLRDLRSRVAIIPQDPVLFSGTIRSNLDPFDEHSDVVLRDAMERVHLVRQESASDTDSQHSDTNSSLRLGSKVSQGGLNLSQGQRQLLCLARALVSRPKIMVLDEATSAVDQATDQLIQKSIREEFKDSTLLVIAHRLSTVSDFDRIAVLSDGRLVEYDSPANLAEKEEGVFADMIEHSHEKDAIMATVRHQQAC